MYDIALGFVISYSSFQFTVMGLDTIVSAYFSFEIILEMETTSQIIEA